MSFPNYITVINSKKHIILRDIGPWDKHKTITNAAEKVVKKQHIDGLGKRKLFYYDSDGYQLTELVHDGEGNFIDFALAD